MNDKFLDDTGLAYYHSKVKNYVDSSIPTVNNATLTIQENGTTKGTFTANSATNTNINITVPTAVSDLTNDSNFQTQTQVENKILEELENFEHLDYEVVQTLPVTGQDGVRYLLYVADQSQQGYHYEEYMYVNNQWIDIGKVTDVNLSDYYTKLETDDLLDAKADTTDIPTTTSQLTNDGDGTSDFVTFADTATENTSGVIKLNPSQNIDVNANGQLTVGGRIGQFEGTTGLYAPNDRQPRQVLDYSFLVTDALGMSIGNRALAVVSGLGITVRSAVAGTTVYYAENTYVNRIIAKTCENGFVSKDEATSKVEMTIPVVSVLINGQTFTPDSSADDPNNPIEITLESSANPDTTITQLRMFGQMVSYATAHIGNGVHTEGGGRNLLVGGGLSKYGSSNDNCMVGQQMYSSGNGNGLFGRNHIAIKNRSFLAGTGHDTTNARGEGVGAVGQYSYLDDKTLFAVGNGTSATDRVNAFEVNVKNGGTAKVNFIEANNGKLEFASTQDIAPSVSTTNWGLGTGGSIVDYDGTAGFATTDVKGTAVNITVNTGVVKPVTAGETLQWSFKARKKTGSETGKLQLNLLKCNSAGGSTSNNIVHDGTAASYTTEWVTYSGSFTVPSGMEFVRPRFTRTNTGNGSAGGYEIKDFTIIQQVDSGIILTSPNGTKYKLAVDNSGNLTTTAV